MKTVKLPKRNTTLISSVIFTVLFLAGSALWAYHETILRGSIVAIEDNTVYVCVGSDDGAKIGDKMDVYHVRIENNDNVSPRLKNIMKKMYRDKAAKIEITQIIDEHFSTAKVLSGKPEIHDIAELINGK